MSYWGTSVETNHSLVRAKLCSRFGVRRRTRQSRIDVPKLLKPNIKEEFTESFPICSSHV